MTGRTEGRVAQSKRARAGLLVLIVDLSQVARVCVVRAFSFGCL